MDSNVFNLRMQDITEENYLKVVDKDRELEHQIGRIKNTEKIFQFVRDNNIKGDIIEFGVYQGAFLIWLSKLRSKYDMNDRKIIGVDCFCGLPDSSGPWTKGVFRDTNIDIVNNNLKKISFHGRKK